MRLKSVYISQYKNLRNFDLAFDGNSFIDVFVGKNGTGKSNLFEALIEIFRHLYEYDNDKAELDFNYRISFEIDGKETEIAWTSGQFKINGKDRKTIGETPLPDNVLIYYSGHNDTVPQLVEQYKEAFRKRIKTASDEDSRRFIGIGPEYKALLLAVLLMQEDSNKARQFICHETGHQERCTGSQAGAAAPILRHAVLHLISRILKPTATGNRRGLPRPFSIVYPTASAWGQAVRYGRKVILRQKIAIFCTSILKRFSKSSAISQELFRQFDNLKTLEMLKDISIFVTLESDTEASIAHFSDGQLQSVYIYAIIELFKDRNCITLLDEPDSFLHPEWQFEFLMQVFEITETAAKNNHVLMSSHSAATLCSLEAQNISLFKIDNSRVSCSKRTKKEIVNELSNSFIQYSEDESKLLIDNVIRSSSKPILFVEGPSDVSIMNTAYAKLYPDTDIPVLIQDAFDRGFIRTLLARHEIFAAYPDKQFFALFDFDDAYNDWRDLGGVHKITDIGLGLCRKISKKESSHISSPGS